MRHGTSDAAAVVLYMVALRQAGANRGLVHHTCTRSAGPVSSPVSLASDALRQPMRRLCPRSAADDNPGTDDTGFTPSMFSKNGKSPDLRRILRQRNRKLAKLRHTLHHQNRVLAAPHRRSTRRDFVLVGLAGTAAALLALLGLVTCPNNTATKAPPAAQFDLALQDAPCRIMPPELIAQTFDLPAAELDQMVVASLCSTGWSGDNAQLNADLVIQVHATVASAHSAFAAATAEQKSRDPAAAQATAFQDVPELGDAARYDVATGALTVRSSNMILEFKVFYGVPPEADDTTPQEFVDVQERWLHATAHTRAEQAQQLAHAVLQAL